MGQAAGQAAGQARSGGGAAGWSGRRVRKVAAAYRASAAKAAAAHTARATPAPAVAAATLWMSGIDYIQGNLVQGAADALDFDFNAAVL